MKSASLAAAVATAILVTPQALGQTDPDQAIKDQTTHIQAETALENAKADRAKAEAARVQALGLPSFEGKAELGANAGAMEVNLLASSALGAAADKIASANSEQHLILLAGDELLDLGAADAMKLQMDAIKAQFRFAGIEPPEPSPPIGGKQPDISPAGGFFPFIAPLTAAAGLLRSDTTLSGADATAVTQQMLVAATAANLARNHKSPLLPAAIVSGIGVKGNELYGQLNELGELRAKAGALQAQLAAKEKPTTAEKSQLALLAAAIARHDAFLAKATSPDDKGVIPFAVAARMADLAAGGRHILRVYVNKAGGSIVNSKNLATTFGLDPIKISGGVVVSYVRSDPTMGTVEAADVLSCDTTLTSIRSVQERRWIALRPKHQSGLCQSLLPAPKPADTQSSRKRSRSHHNSRG